MNKELENLIPDNPLDCLKALRKSANIYCSFNNTQCEYNKKLADNIEKALKYLETINNANYNEALKYVNGKIADLEDDLQHYTMVEKDKCKEFFIKEDLKQFTNIKQALLNLLKAQKDEKLKVDICEMFGLDNLFPYNDTKAILKELEEYMGRKNQLWTDYMKTSKELKEQKSGNYKKALEIIFEKNVDIELLKESENRYEYNMHFPYREIYHLTEEEFDLIKKLHQKL